MGLSFIVIAYNAAKYLPGLLCDLLDQDYPCQQIEVVLVDSLSTDDTRKIMSDFQSTKSTFFHRILVLDNPYRTLPCGWNVALPNVATDFVLRVDAHVKLPKDFISRNIECICSGKDICGGRVLSILENDTMWARTLLSAENSMFGGGFTYFRRGKNAQYTKTLAFAMYRAEIFRTVGPYDERLVRTEDNEMHYRMRKSGFQFYFNPLILSYRYSRNSLCKLLRQKYLNGYWVGRTFRISPKCLSIFYFAPFLLFIGSLLCIICACISTQIPLVILLTIYLVTLIASCIPVVLQGNFNFTTLSLPLLLFLLHGAYGLGTIVGLGKIGLFGKI